MNPRGKQKCLPFFPDMAKVDFQNVELEKMDYLKNSGENIFIFVRPQLFITPLETSPPVKLNISN